MRQGHWAVVDLIGKGGHIRTVPIPQWVKAALDQWVVAARVTEGRIFSSGCQRGKGVWKRNFAECRVDVVKGCCERAGLEHIPPHDCGELARNCATVAVASWNGFNSCWGMHPSRQRNAIWAANRISDTQ